jgi:hypothetical protein
MGGAIPARVVEGARDLSLAIERPGNERLVQQRLGALMCLCFKCVRQERWHAISTYGHHTRFVPEK